MLLFARASSSSQQKATLIRSALPNLQRLVAEQCPSLTPSSKSAFRPSPFLRTGHLQTLYASICDTTQIDKIPFYRKLIMTPDGGLIALDITAFPSEGKHDDDETPTLIVTHGLTGGSSESYVRAVLYPLCSPKAEGGKGYRAVVINSRGCAHTPVTSPQLYSASKTADVRCALLWATRAFPNSPLIGIGFSLGANFIAKTTAEDGEDTPFVSVIPVAAPWDLLRGSEALEGDGPGGSILSSTYSNVLASNLRAVIGSHCATLALHTPLKPHLAALLRPLKSKTEYYQYCQAHQTADEGEWTIPAGRPEGSHLVTPKSLRHVDDTITRLGGGHSHPYGEFPLRSAKAYYVQGGAGQTRLLQNVRVPMLALNADDDPIVPLPVLAGVFEIMGDQAKEVYNQFATKFKLPHHVPWHSTEEVKEEQKRWKEQSSLSADPAPVVNENVTLAYTRGGGHLGWYTGSRPTRWLAKPIGEWVDMISHRVERARELARAEAEEFSSISGKGSLVNEDERRERDWAMRSFNKSLWRRDEQSAQRDDDHRRIRTVEVQVELVDERKLPVYDFETSDFAKHPEQVPKSGKAAPPISPLRSKVPFLLTKLLEHAPLVHPKDASIGWHNDPKQRRPVYDGSWEQGKIINLTMHIDSEHPEVGFAELPADSQVAGVGVTFDAASEVPGQSEEEEKWFKANTKKSWYKAWRKSSSRAGVVRGL
ncbi:unnamed protein product [Tilletia laevis]|uniref:AB hydrolase-1 domain-containing protein n=2 Tax=Tilletia TaxID=13289 RepID=A0A177V734_9BASI|nr:hypothetical protein CF336_g541 [Tilletia laevis]KAE8264983.1 hypothetical protein A4X03_0g566 [Tilletia caries]KAE8208267.1 hypothetical protein CF335_g546 [Tilletia laevis]CAD6885306.1 unnamed protein product [Tilletia caries]CAD6909011.1 unnamed protein product [Tilletia laevis]